MIFACKKVEKEWRRSRREGWARYRKAAAKLKPPAGYRFLTKTERKGTIRETDLFFVMHNQMVWCPTSAAGQKFTGNRAKLLFVRLKDGAKPMNQEGLWCGGEGL